MNNTRRMTEILGQLRRERNGVVADAMRVSGRACGLNYGVSLPTLRTIAQDIGVDHEFAKYLYQQDVRELRLVALTIADQRQVVGSEIDFWAAGIINSEIAEEAAMRLLNRISDFDRLFFDWTSHNDRFLQYAALMAAARRTDQDIAWARVVVDVTTGRPDDMLLASGCVAMLSALARWMDGGHSVECVVRTLPRSPASDFIRDELSWRIG